MTIETTTIETSNTVALGANFSVKVYEQKLDVFCDCCSNTARGTKDSLENRGWSFGGGAEFCPECF